MTFVSISSFDAPILRCLQRSLQVSYVLPFLVLGGGSLSTSQWLSASELVMADLNLGIESLPTEFDFTVRDGTSSRSGSSEFDLGFGLTTRGAYAFSSPGSRSAFFIGGAVALGGYTFEGDGRYYNAMVRAIAGYAYAYNDQWTFEVSPYYGYGIAQMHIPGLGLNADYDVDGNVTDYGVNIGVTYTLAKSWLVGARLGWQVADTDLSGDGLQVETSQSGPTVFLGIIYRFGGSPPPIR